MGSEGLLATLLAQAEGRGVDLITLRALVEESSQVNLAVQMQSSGDLLLNWTRRSRQGFAWVDEIDAPVGEAVEQYRVTLSGTAAGIEITADQSTTTISAETVAALGSGSVTIAVQQIGDFAASRAAQISLNLP